MQNVLFATALAFGMVAAQALAQQATEESSPPASTAPALNLSFTDTQLQNFIEASKKVAAISQEYTPKIESTVDEQNREEILREVDKQMISAVETEGLSVQEFNTINQQLPQDPQLEQRVVKMLNWHSLCADDAVPYYLNETGYRSKSGQYGHGARPSFFIFSAQETA